MTTPLADILDKLSEETNQQLAQLLEDAAEQRDSVKGGAITDSPTDMHTQLLQTRAALDRVEQIVSSIAQVKAKTAQAVEDRQNAYDDAYAAIVNKPGQHCEEYSTGKEREAKYSVATIEEKLDLRRAQKFDRQVGAALEFVRLLHRGIDGTRRDLDTRIRLISLATALEH